MTVNPTTFFLGDATMGMPVAGMVAADGRSATFSTVAPLAVLTTSRVRVFSMQDLAGNVFSGTSVPARFTTVP